jgi:4-hydroxybenzoate polyprenyltransferase
LWPSLTAVWLASEGNPELLIVIIFCLGSFFMRSAGVIINDYFDQDIDRKVLRTFNRPIANNSVSNKEAIALFLILLILSSCLLLFLNLKSLYIALFCILLISTYPLMKRFLPIPQLYLGICYSMGIFMAYAFYQGAFPLNCWLLFFGNIFWVLAYDTVYALSDRQDDLLINVKSSAIYFQGKEKLILWISYFLLITFLLLIGIFNSFSLLYFLAVSVNILLILFLMIATNFDKPSDCSKFFRKNHWLGIGIFLSFVAAFV